MLFMLYIASTSANNCTNNCNIGNGYDHNECDYYDDN